MNEISPCDFPVSFDSLIRNAVCGLQLRKRQLTEVLQFAMEQTALPPLHVYENLVFKMAGSKCLNFDSDFFNKYTTHSYYLNRGASGNVYGPIEWNGVQVALKHATFADGQVTETLKKDIEVKQEIWTSLEHKNLTKIHSVDLNQLPQAMYIVMEFAPFGSLNKTLRSLGLGEKLPIDVVTDWTKQIVEGMLYLHDKNIVHRDLKSSNILLMDFYNVRHPLKMVTLKITDFDEVKEHNHTTTMSFVGTCAYMAPEVLKNQWFSKASDVWSFAVLTWEMLSGNIPYQGLEASAIMYKSLNGELDSLSIEKSFPAQYKSILTRCWRSEWKDRPTFQNIFCDLKKIALENVVTEMLNQKRKTLKKFSRDSSTENLVIKRNYQFLMENIESFCLVGLLYKNYCITDDERDHLLGQSTSAYRNRALLQWMKMVPFKEDEGKAVLDCLRQTQQKFVADLLQRGGVLMESNISTKLVNTGLLSKWSIKKVDTLKGMEAVVINRLNQPEGLSLSNSREPSSELPEDDIVIAPYCRQENNGILVWFWCQSIDGQRNLKRMHESGALLEKLATIFKEFSLDNVSSSSKFLIPISIRLSFSNFTGNKAAWTKSDITDERSSDPSGEFRVKLYSLLIEPLADVNGVAVLGQEIVISRVQRPDIDFFNSVTFHFKRRMKVDGMSRPEHVVSCSIKNCLYVFDWEYQEGLPAILRIDPSNGKLIKTWSTYGGGGLLSVAIDTNVILNINLEAKLHEYTPDGELIRIIDLGPGTGIKENWHAVKLSEDLFVVCHGGYEDPLSRVCLLSTKQSTSTGNRIDVVKILASFGGEQSDILMGPKYLSVDREGSILVSDDLKKQAVLLNSTLDKPQVLISDILGVISPWRTCFDESAGRWLLADHHNVMVCLT